ncbi:hypothetical protein G4228_014172 [Cervus hanglu yarkandensis]|nr:hypothetical protein G4228_014172 [Cervus hanglu yarkandensis]
MVAIVGLSRKSRSASQLSQTVCILIIVAYIIYSVEKSKSANGTTMFPVELIHGLDTM